MASETALFWGGYIVSPVLCGLTMCVFAIALRRALSPLQAAMTIISLICITPLLGSFLPGRPDHYAVLIPVMAVIIWGLILLFTTADWKRGATLIGIALPMALWVNISGVLVAFIVPVALGLRWLMSGQPWSLYNQRISGIASLTCLAILFVERPPLDALSVIEFDRVSIWHLCVFVAIFAFWTAIRAIEQKWPTLSRAPLVRLLPAVPLGIGGVGILLLAFPHVLGPDHGIPVDPLYASLRLNRIQEYYPILGTADFKTMPTLLAAVTARVSHLLPLIVAFVGMLILLIRDTPDRRWVWGTLLFVAAVSVLLTWPLVPAWMPMILVLMIPGHGLVAALAFSALPKTRLIVRVPTRVALALAVLIGPVIAQSIVHKTEKSDQKTVLTHCTVNELARWLGSALPPTPSLNIMALADLGAELMYRTPHNVYAIPNHRYQPGFTMRWAVISAPTQAEARAKAAEAQVDILLVCDFAGDIDPRNPTQPPPPFKTQLLRGDVPEWLDPLPAPDTVSDTVRVFRVRL